MCCGVTRRSTNTAHLTPNLTQKQHIEHGDDNVGLFSCPNSISTSAYFMWLHACLVLEMSCGVTRKSTNTTAYLTPNLTQTQLIEHGVDNAGLCSCPNPTSQLDGMKVMMVLPAVLDAFCAPQNADSWSMWREGMVA